jgi:hypothetical protein
LANQLQVKNLNREPRMCLSTAFVKIFEYQLAAYVHCLIFLVLKRTFMNESRQLVD